MANQYPYSGASAMGQNLTGGYYQTNYGTGQSFVGTQQSANAFAPTQPTRSYLPGRIVQNEQAIVANEVPMDGSLGVFVQQDLQQIFTKTWGNDGFIHTDVYQLVTGKTPQNDPVNEILTRLQRIEERLNIDPPSEQPRQKSYPKKKYYNKNNQNRNREVQKND